MGKRASYHWDKREQKFRTDAGGRTRYFPGIARDDHAAIAAAFSAHLADLAAQAKPAEATVFDLCGKFLDAPRGVDERTRRSHQERLAKFCAWTPPGGRMIGARPAAEIRASDLKAALRAWEEAGHSDHYRAGLCRSAKAAFGWAASEEGGRIIPQNPLAEVKGPKVERSPERYAERGETADFLRFAWRRVGSTPEALKRRDAALRWRAASGLHSTEAVCPPAYGRLYHRFGRLLALMVRVGVHTGARPGDLCSAWWEDFDGEKGTITLPPDRHKTGKKTGRALVIHLGPSLARALRRERDRPGRHPRSIFTHKRGRGAAARGEDPVAGVPWGRFVVKAGKESFEDDSTPLSQKIRLIRKEAIRWQEERRAKAIRRGVPEREAPAVTIRERGDNRFVFYRLRHTRASDYLMRGGHESTVAALLGTSPRMIETVYGHLLDDHLSREAKKLRDRGAKGRAGEGPASP